MVDWLRTYSMPKSGQVLKMRSWMVGVVIAFIAVSFMPELLPIRVSFAGLIIFGIASLWRIARTHLACGFLLGLAAANLYGHSLLEHRLSAPCEAISLSVEGTILTLPRQFRTRDGGFLQRFEFKPDMITPSRCEGPRRLLLSYYGESRLHPGERWRFSVKLKKPWGPANPGTFNIQAWYAQGGIDATGSIHTKKALLLSSSANVWRNFNFLRQDLSDRIELVGLTSGASAILKAMTVADKSGIDGSLWGLFQFYGINHLLVISGLHIGIIAGVGYLMGGLLARLSGFLGAVRLAEHVPGVVALVFAFAYAALAGFTLATIRALFMLACIVVAGSLGRWSLSWNNLLIACLLVLLANPLSAIGSGFWLSFTAVGCLLWLSMWRTGVRLPLRLFHTHVYMALAMIPLGGWFFGGVSHVAVLANFILIPLAGFFVVPLALLASVIHLLGLPHDRYLWQIAAWPPEELLPLAVGFADDNSEFLYTHLSPSPAAVILAMVALALLLVPLPGRTKILIVILALPITLPVRQASRSGAEMTVLDVGQGTAVVLRSGEHTLVYDTGGGDPDATNMASRIILPYLQSRGVSTIHTLLISHPDNDHSAGIKTILRSMPVEQLLLGGPSQEHPGGRTCRAGEAWQWPSGERFQILSPESPAGLKTNNSSCVLQIHIGRITILLPGDIEASREKDLLRYWREGLQSDLMMAAHHGSLTSSSHSWLKTVQPGYVIFSAGYLNQFGHPHPKIRERFKIQGSTILSTAPQGAVEIQIDPAGTLLIKPYRAHQRRYWM